MIENLLELDRSLFLFLNGLGDPVFDIFWLVITNKILNAIIYFILALFFSSKVFPINIPSPKPVLDLSFGLKGLI